MKKIPQEFVDNFVISIIRRWIFLHRSQGWSYSVLKSKFFLSVICRTTLLFFISLYSKLTKVSNKFLLIVYFDFFKLLYTYPIFLNLKILWYAFYLFGIRLCCAACRKTPRTGFLHFSVYCTSLYQCILYKNPINCNMCSASRSNTYARNLINDKQPRL